MTRPLRFPLGQNPARWEIARAWCWASVRPAELRRAPELWDDPALLDLDEALAAGWEPIAYVPSISALGGRMILRREK